MEVGAVIGGRYRLTALIGEGGMASVWRAQDETLQRSVAIKLLYLRAQRDPQAQVEQFLREARLAASIQHRNVIHTVDFGVTSEQLPFMVMELLHGESLADRFARTPALGIEEVVHVASLTLRGLSAVHAAGIVHRDLKPHNVFLQRDADAVYPKILDFGISRSLAGGSASAIATQEGLIVGTPDYMAPEQARGEADIDRRADIYSMGAILFEGISGRMPFQAPTVGELIVQIVTTTPPTLSELRPDVPLALSECVERAMSHDREQRYSDAASFRDALTRAAEQAFGPVEALQLSDSPPRRVRAPGAVAARPGTRAGVAAPQPAGFGSLMAAGAPLVSRAPSTPEAPSGLAPPAAGGWGELESPSLRSERRNSVPVRNAATASALAAEPAVGAPVAPNDRALATVLDRTEPANRQSTAQANKAAGARTKRAGRGSVANSGPLSPHDDALLGDNPLDVFADPDGGSLELDFAHAPALAARASALSAPGPRAAPRVSAANELKPARARRRSQPSAAAWLLPLLLGLGLLALLVLPSLFSLHAPDTAAAAAREAANPALQDGLRWGPKPRPKLVEVAPAQRDVTF
jgi:serine/threonine protein kinase